jgi:type IV fimbrial biogenesis protein FimT
MNTFAPYQNTNKSDGFSLIELMVTIAILAIVIAIAVPSYSDMTVRKRTQGLTTAITTDMEFLLAEAAKRNQEVSILFSSTGYRITYNSGTLIKSMTYANNYTGSSATADFGGSPVGYTYDPKLGRLTGNTGSVTVTNGSRSLKISVNPLGRPSICGSFGGYPACP